MISEQNDMQNEPLIYIVPDVHGRKFWKVLKDLKTDKPIVFLGDYLDPYGFEGITPDDAIEDFKEILEFKKEHPDQVTLLLGNHDCEYALSKRICNCRCDNMNYQEIQDMFRNNWDWFNMTYEFENNGTKWLLSHAGVHYAWLEDWSYTSDDIKNFNSLLNKKDQKFIASLESVSPERGGFDRAGSIVWSDILEYLSLPEEKQAATGYDRQVCGHTYLNGSPLTFDSITCIDCQKVFYINSGNELKEVNELKEAE